METTAPQSRKQQVLSRLLSSLDEWVDGNELASEQVGGSEGHRRIRELREIGYVISKRRHPDPKRPIYQYSLRAAEPIVKPTPVDIVLYNGPPWKREWTCETCGSEPFDRPLRVNGNFGLARCATCKSRRFFRSTAA